MRKKYQKNFVYPVILKFYIIFSSKKFINGLDKKPFNRTDFFHQSDFLMSRNIKLSISTIKY